MRSFGLDPVLWEPSETWQRRHRQSMVYQVQVRVEPTAALDSAWVALGSERGGSTDEIGIGGAVLRRLAPDTVAVVSGGEDALDSLDWCLNETLAEAVLRADPDARLSIQGQQRVDEH